MLVFKTFLRILNKNKLIIIFFSALLIFFGGFNMKTSQNSMSFQAKKPDILIVNLDEEKGITKSLINYMSKNCNIVSIENSEEKIDDALFFRDVSYVIYIPENFNNEFFKGNILNINIKSTGDYESAYASMLLNRYINVAKSYTSVVYDESIVDKIEETLNKSTEVEVKSKLDYDNLAKACFYYNFLSYSIVACLIYVVSLILTSFKNENIQKRIAISSVNYRKYNTSLLISNVLFAAALWIIYVLLSFLLVKNVMFTLNGLMYILNSFVFTLCATSLSFFIANLLRSKNSIIGVTNVVSLGFSFLCGAFIPMSFLPKKVETLSHIFPTHYYIKSNEILKTLEKFNITSLKEVILNLAILLVFSVIFIIFSNIISRKNRRFN